MLRSYWRQSNGGTEIRIHQAIHPRRLEVHPKILSKAYRRIQIQEKFLVSFYYLSNYIVFALFGRDPGVTGDRILDETSHARPIS